MGMERSSYAQRPSDFNWLDGKNVADAYENFAAGEPNNLLGQENCGVFYTNNGEWYSERCDSSRYFICQQDKGKMSRRIFSIGAIAVMF